MTLDRDDEAMMMHERISVHHVAFPTADVAQLARHFRAVGARRATLWSGLLAGDGMQQVQAMRANDGIGVDTVLHVFRPEGLLSGDRAMAAATDQLAQAIVDSAAIGARSLYLLTGGRGGMAWAVAAEAFAAAIAPCLRQARAAGITLSVETTTPLHAHLHLGTSLRDAARLAEIADIGLCIDLFGCWTESDIEEQLRRLLPRIDLVQVSDHVPGDMALPCRAVPGDGAIPLDRLLHTLIAGGYAGLFDLELLGPRIEAEGAEAAILRGAGRLGAILARLGA